MTPADMRARADWLEKWCEEKTTPAMLRAGADAIEEVARLREALAAAREDAKDAYTEGRRDERHGGRWE